MSSLQNYFPTTTAPSTDPRALVWRQSIFKHMYMQNLMQTFLSSASSQRSASVKPNAVQSSCISINSTKCGENEAFSANCRKYDIVGSRNKNLQREPSTLVPSASLRYLASMKTKPACDVEVKLSDTRNRNRNAENDGKESSKIVNWLIDPSPALPRCSYAISKPETTRGRSVSFTPSSSACGDCSESNGSGTRWYASENSRHPPPPPGARSRSRMSDTSVPTTYVHSSPPLSSSSAFGTSDSTGSWQNGIASARLTWMTSSSVIADYQCRMCSKRYATIGAARLHARTHTLPCRCPACGKAFSRPWLLRGHWRTHTGERPFQCPDPSCRRAFADRSNLRAHLQTHADVKKHACVRCSKTFSRVSLLVKHRRTCERGKQLHELSQIVE